ncbi:UrcA family protein [Altererythrobacter aerius]|uniref:UrcA family protein n=1 Tax=Tsuneonella aeria TaxID=1837929 RepID=A0A6I4TFB1_9SPHN|nr:UrcA family protein [Tsuneonella aeria]MXO75404.1 UrcA family protein [Tsuneonella aeria]
MKTFLLTLSALAVVAGAPAAAAEQTVVYRDLDLSTPQGQKTFDNRIRKAARDVCELRVADTGSRIRSAEATACYDLALRNARTRMAAIVDGAQKGG